MQVFFKIFMCIMGLFLLTYFMMAVSDLNHQFEDQLQTDEVR